MLKLKKTTTLCPGTQPSCLVTWSCLSRNGIQFSKFNFRKHPRVFGDRDCNTKWCPEFFSIIFLMLLNNSDMPQYLFLAKYNVYSQRNTTEVCVSAHWHAHLGSAELKRGNVFLHYYFLTMWPTFFIQQSLSILQMCHGSYYFQKLYCCFFF